jgi:hypothetical protein
VKSKVGSPYCMNMDGGLPFEYVDTSKLNKVFSVTNSNCLAQILIVNHGPGILVSPTLNVKPTLFVPPCKFFKGL